MAASGTDETSLAICDILAHWLAPKEKGVLNPFLQKLVRGFPLSDDDVARLRRVSTHVRNVAAGADMIAEGDVPDRVHVIQKGFACRSKMLPDGTRAIVAILIPGDMCDLHISILGHMDHALVAITPCELALLPRDIVEELVDNHPMIRRALQWAGLVDEAILREWLVGMGRRSAETLVAHLFCELLLRLQVVGLATADSFDFPLTQVDLGDIAGLSAVHVNRVLQNLRSKDLIVLQAKRLTIPDVDRLKAFAQFNPNYLHLEPRQGSWLNRYSP